MKKYKVVIIAISFLCIHFECFTQTGIKGTVFNANPSDSIALFNPFNRQAPPLEKSVLGKKGAFEFKYQPSEIGFYFIGLSTGKTILIVLKPGNNGQVEIDASTGMITKVTDSEQNSLLKSFTEMYADYDKKQAAIDQAADKAPELKNLEKQLVERDRFQAIQNLLVKNTNNYASAALIEYLPMDNFLTVHDTVLTTLIKKYPENPIIKAKYQELEPAKKLAVGYPAPEITLEDTAGNMFSLSSLKGKVVLIDFWASWCKPCRDENPKMVRLYQEYNKYGFEILGVSLDQSKANWVRAIQADGLNWNQISDLKGWQSAAGATYGVRSIPFTVLVDKNGNVIAKGLRGEALEHKVKEILLRQ